MPANLTDQAFGELTALRRIRHPEWNYWVWECRCACGVIVLAAAEHLRNGRTLRCVSCRRAKRRLDATKHGGAGFPEYRVWNSAKERCFNPKTKSFPRYGGRGITMCEDWRSGFAAFIRDTGRRPSPQHTLERRDNDGPYAPDNCYWATRIQQAANTSANRYLTHDGKTQILAGWARDIGFDQSVIRERLDRGLSVAEALSPMKRPRSGGSSTHGGTPRRFLTANGETLSLADWARRLNTRAGVIQRRIDNRGWTVEEAVTIPPLSRNSLPIHARSASRGDRSKLI